MGVTVTMNKESRVTHSSRVRIREKGGEDLEEVTPVLCGHMMMAMQARMLLTSWNVTGNDEKKMNNPLFTLSHRFCL